MVRYLILSAMIVSCSKGDRPSGRPASNEGNKAPTAAVDVCPRDATSLAQALLEVASHDVPTPAADDVLLPVEWTPEFRAWNELQSESHHVDVGVLDAPGAVARHRAWVHALRSRQGVLETGPFEIRGDPQPSFRAGPEDSGLTVQVASSAGCWLVDDK